MGMINQYIKYLYYLLLIIIIVLINIIMLKIFTISDDLEAMNSNITNISKNINADKDKTTSIKNTVNSWKFFISIYAIMVVIRETFKYRKRYKSLSRSLSASLVRHSRQLRSLR